MGTIIETVTAASLVRGALALLNYRTDEVGDPVALAALNQVGIDVCRTEDGLPWQTVYGMSDTVETTPAVADAVICGVAARLALSTGDVDAEEAYSGLYGAKRRALSRTPLYRGDVIPGGGFYGGA